MTRNATVIGRDCDGMYECFSPSAAIPWETDFAALVPRFTGGLSAISSTLIIYVILRSETRLSSIYHRIMFGMSLADICGSIAMALTSLPMPSYMPKEEIFGYTWAGARLGNAYTCNAQGFFATFGMVCMFNYNAMLCVYYACAIAFVMQETNIKKYVEPKLHTIPILAGLSLSVPPLFYEMYNPGIAVYAWCGPVTYPNTCGPDVDIECIRGNSDMKRILQIILSSVMTYVFLLIFLPLTMVIWKIIQTDRVMTEISKLYDKCGYDEDMQQVLNKQRNIKAVLLQAVSYIAAFLLGAIPPVLLAQRAVTTVGKSQDGSTSLLERLMLVFLPLQGFFNFFIFVSHKVYNYRRVHHDVSVCRVLYILFRTSFHDPCFISRMFIVKNGNEQDEECTNKHYLIQQQQNFTSTSIDHHQGYRIDIRDESNEELHYRLGLMNHHTEQLASGDDEDTESHTKSLSLEETTCSAPPLHKYVVASQQESWETDEEGVHVLLELDNDSFSNSTGSGGMAFSSLGILSSSSFSTSME